MFREDYEIITVHLVGGPFAGKTKEEPSLRGWGPPSSGLIMLHGPIDAVLDTFYGSARWDEESSRWVRCHIRTRLVERVES